MRILGLIVGVICLLLGGLWLLQGLGIVHIDPIFCVAECAPLEGPEPTWVVFGLLLMLAGGLAIFLARRRRRG